MLGLGIEVRGCDKRKKTSAFYAGTLYSLTPTQNPCIDERALTVWMEVSNVKIKSRVDG